MGKIIKTLGIVTGSVLLGATLLIGYPIYTELKRQCSVDNKKVVEKVVKEINRQGLEGIMNSELVERKTNTKFSDQYFDFDNAEILKCYYNENSDKLVVYIRDVHKLSFLEGKNLVQDNLYNTIDELCKENDISLLVLEGTHQEELTKEFINSNISIWYKLFWRAWHGFWIPEAKEDALKAFSGGVAYEYINDTKVETRGAEDEDTHDAAWNIAKTPVRSEGKIWLFEKVITDRRSEIGVEKILQYMKEYDKKKAMLVFGAAHTKKIVELLEKEGVSYIVVQPKGVDDYIKELEKYSK